MRATAAGSGNLLVWVFCGVPRAGLLIILEPILYWRFLFVIEETARDGLAANCVQMYVAAPPLERAGVSGCPAQPACATLPTRVRGTR